MTHGCKGLFCPTMKWWHRQDQARNPRRTLSPVATHGLLVLRFRDCEGPDDFMWTPESNDRRVLVPVNRSSTSTEPNGVFGHRNLMTANFKTRIVVRHPKRIIFPFSSGNAPLLHIPCLSLVVTTRRIKVPATTFSNTRRSGLNPDQLSGYSDQNCQKQAGYDTKNISFFAHFFALTMSACTTTSGGARRSRGSGWGQGKSS